MDPQFSASDDPSSEIQIQSTESGEHIPCSGCTYVVPSDQHIIDGNLLKLQPGSVIGLSEGVIYGNLIFRNIVGTPDNPIIIRNCGGIARVNGTGLAYAIKTENSKDFRITGGNDHDVYGISITGGRMGITLDRLSTNFEVDHVEVLDAGFAGIMAKTDPNCDDATIRGNFVMEKVFFHHNYIDGAGGEGFYVGNSFYEGMNRDCGLRLPHEIHIVKIFKNIIKNPGREGIQLGCATRGAKVYDNIIENYGVANLRHQNSGMQLGSGTGGICYNNLIENGTGNGLIVLGLGDNVIYNNVIVNAGDLGIFCDERISPGPGFKFINNTIINPKTDGIRIYAEKVPMNVIRNNVIVNPGAYYTYTYPYTPDDAFIFTLGESVKIDMSGNYFSADINEALFVDVSRRNFRPASGSPLVDRGADISGEHINNDFYKKARLKGAAYDIGAAEY